ncbi:MAG TPA: hypothetical protein VI136_22465 [Verrucomicrobiae bacterium]
MWRTPWFQASISSPIPADCFSAGRRRSNQHLPHTGDFFPLQHSETFIALLKENNVRQEWQFTDGDHSWPVWRNYLAEFAPKLFQ